VDVLGIGDGLRALAKGRGYSGKRRGAAKLLGMHPRTLQHSMKNQVSLLGESFQTQIHLCDGGCDRRDKCLLREAGTGLERKIENA